MVNSIVEINRPLVIEEEERTHLSIHFLDIGTVDESKIPPLQYLDG